MLVFWGVAQIGSSSLDRGTKNNNTFIWNHLLVRAVLAKHESSAESFECHSVKADLVPEMSNEKRAPGSLEYIGD